jgi:hypothetical protein
MISYCAPQSTEASVQKCSQRQSLRHRNGRRWGDGGEVYYHAMQPRRGAV